MRLMMSVMLPLGLSLALLVTMLLSVLPALAQPSPCSSLQDCLAAVENTAAPGNGITREEQALAKVVQTYGRAAVPGLLALLGSRDPDVRALAAYTLRDLDGLTEAEVAPLLRVLSAGEEWVAPALGRIGSRAAIEGLFGVLTAHPKEHTQVTFAFERLGRKGIPTLLGAFDCPTGCDQRLLSVIAFIFGELGPDAVDAVTRLTEIALNEQRPPEARKAAVVALGSIGESAATAAPALRRLAEGAPGVFDKPIQLALRRMKVPAAGEGLAASLAKDPSTLLLRDAAALGTSGRPSLPT